MTWLRDLSIPDQLALEPKGFFRVETTRRGQLITINRPDQPVERYLCPSPGIANQLRQQLSDKGLAGFVEGAL